MRRAAIIMYVVGGLVCLSGLWITQSTHAGRVGQGTIAAVLLLGGALLAVTPQQPRWMLEASVLVGIALISALIAFLEESGSAPSFYLWPVVYTAYFSSPKVVKLAFGWMAVSLAAALIVNTTYEMKADTFVAVVATVGMMAGLVSTMTTQQRRLRVELARAADTDPLTGLLNRRSFNPRLDALVAEAGGSGRSLSVVMFDLDHFKKLNDRHGHIVGDLALQEAADVLRAQSRGQDLVSRFGGEEFAVALPGADADAARAYTERVAAALQRLEIADGLVLSASAGICSLGADAGSGDALMLGADAALYAAKAGGRCRSALWHGEITVNPPFGEPAAA